MIRLSFAARSASDWRRRWQEMEIKHGRIAMAACTHVFLTTAGVRWPGYLSFAEDIKFSDMPGGAIASWAAPDRFEVGPCFFCLGRYFSLGKSGDEDVVLCCGDVRDIEGNPPGYWVFEGATSSQV